MKFQFNGKYVQAIAENVKESHALLDLASAPEPKVATKKHRKHQFYKNCWCGKRVKGNIGLGIHQAVAHKDGITSLPVTEE
jgi:hypothetical protein